ncbi:MAG: Bcr/CflA family drug resistance efflux transporter [Kangiella sp.]|nr:MAG: Bcr/CflA family drug resistance efflux transporter [Kangiella sp.]
MNTPIPSPIVANSAKNPIRYLPLFAAISAVTPLAIDMYLPAMPKIAESLNTDIGLLQNSLSIYLFAYALGMFIFGPLADSIGRKKMLIIGLSGFTIFSLLVASSTTGDEFLIYRSLQAIFGGASTLVIPGTIRLLFGKDTVKGLSYVSSIMMIAPMLAPTIGGVILEVTEWRMIFYVLAMYSVVILLLCLRYFPDLEQKSISVSSFKQLYLASYNRILSNKRTRRYLIISMLASFTFFTYLTGISFIYITVFGLSESMFGILFGINVLVLIFANLTNAKIAVKFGANRMISSIWFIAFVFSSFLLMSAWRELDWIYLVLGLIPLMGCLMATIINTDTEILKEFAQHTGTATAVIGTLRFGSGAIAGPLLAFFYDGSAMPFAVLIFSGIILIGIVHFSRNNTVK